MKTSPLPASAQKVQDTLHSLGYSYRVVEMSESTRTAAEAAAAVGCTIGQIAKSLVFRTRNTRRAVLVITSGINRVDERLLREVIGEKIGRADADFVRQVTGFAIGGVPPIGHVTPIQTYIDRDLLQYAYIWAAAGTPHTVFQLSPQDLVKMTGGAVIAVC
ncbi:MAG: YbaK/EbsC family protein [Anaerolineales bacterium]